MAKFRDRYLIVDHENGNTVQLGPIYVLSPAKNPADLAALHTLIDNVEPELAAHLREFVSMIESFPERELGGYGTECLPHITHAKVKPFALKRLEGS